MRLNRWTWCPMPPWQLTLCWREAAHTAAIGAGRLRCYRAALSASRWISGVPWRHPASESSR
eukprot:7501689-Alexandrium_andersonii.AAC.1